MPSPSIDRIRDVPEIATRIVLGAQASVAGNGVVVVELDGRQIQADVETVEAAKGVANAMLLTAPEGTLTASDILELRHKAEDIYLQQLCLQDKKLRSCLFVPSGPSAGSYYRSMIPADAINSAGLAITHHTRRLDLAKAVRYDAVWVQLAAVPFLRGILEQAKRQNVKVIYDIDDRPDKIPEHNPSHKIFKDFQLSEILEMLQLADLVTVSQRKLLEWAEQYAERVTVAPNMIPAAIWPPCPRRAKEFKRVLWAGSPTHKPDLEMIARPLLKILQERKDVRFCFFGEDPPEILKPVSDQIDLLPFVSFEDYAETLASIDADLAVAPLASHPFNETKSALKLLEYGACGIPAIASAEGEYPELVEAGMPADLVNRPDDWESALRRYLDFSIGKLRRRGSRARKWVQENRCIISSKGEAWVGCLEEAFR